MKIPAREADSTPNGALSTATADFPGGDQNQLLRSIRETLFRLPDDVTVYPGHGPATSIGDERRHNPFCGEMEG